MPGVVPRLHPCLALLAALLALGVPSTAGAAPPIRHVFVIVLENENADKTFGPSAPSPYLAKTLPAMGAFVPNYYGIGHASLDNYVAMVSGQGPNMLTQADCPLFIDVVPGIVGAGGQASGLGCVYPKPVQTIGGQLRARGLSWRGYMQSMGADPTRESATCGHPAIGSPDGTEAATAKDQYATRHDPFMYFHSVIDDRASCDQHVVPLDRLTADLASATSTPAYTFITPDLCADGHDASCADPSRPGGYAGIDGFLSTWVPRIVGSAAFHDGGLLAVIFDESESSDSSSCCNEPGTSGGGRTGAVFVSPYIRGGTVTQTAYNHYSLLRSFEDMFGVGHLGYAAASGLATLGSDVFTAPSGDGLAPSAPRCNATSRALRAARIVRSGGRTHLRLEADARTTASLRIRTRSGRTSRRTLHVPACGRRTVTLPRGHGRVVVRAGGKSRTVTY
jgi:hypothetical protein